MTEKLWLRGGFPRSFLADTEQNSWIWRENYISTFLETDIPRLGIHIPAETLRRFWMMLSHYHGQVFNASELGRSFGISDITARKYLDILAGTFMVRILPAWFANTAKRQVKSPKIYLRDSGIFHALQTIRTKEDLLSNPKLGASWEGFALETISETLKNSMEGLFFWQIHSGASVDLFWKSGGKNFGVEFKYADAPKRTKSLEVAVSELKLEHLWIVYPGPETYPLSPDITVIPLAKADTLPG
ncbi:MAG: DUF4143 domain-containing protein [Phaeospirillum sp.]|nr:DUF4143 domain-containing protein [Phaeospirillum sp.]